MFDRLVEVDGVQFFCLHVRSGSETFRSASTPPPQIVEKVVT